MAARRINPRKITTSAIPTSGLLLMLACATPVIAAQNSSSKCPELEEAGLQVQVLKFAAASLGDHRDSRNPESAAPSTQPAATARAVPPESKATDTMSTQGLLDSTSGPLAESHPVDTPSTITQKVESSERLPDIQTRIPGVSSVELQRFKRQMYRRDI